MKKFTIWLFEYLFKRSPRQAMIPQVPQSPPEDPFADLEQGNVHPIEKYFTMNHWAGRPLKLSGGDIAYKDGNDQLVRGHINPFEELGCGHLVDRFQPTKTDNNHIRGISLRFDI